MVEVTRDGDRVRFEVKGWHKVWALKGGVDISAAHIRGVRRDSSIFKRGMWRAIRASGTYVPGIIVAGTFYCGGKPEFWDVSHGERVVVVDLADERYERLVIEVEDPDAVLDLLNDAPEPAGIG